MKLPFYKSGPGSLTFSLLLLMVYVLLLLTGLGVFRLFFSFDWTAGADNGEFFALRIRGGQSLNVFEAPPFGRVFWLTQCCLIIMCLLITKLRVAGSFMLAVLTAIVVSALHFQLPASPVGTPLEFELFIILLLTVVYILLSYAADRRDQQKTSQLLSKFVPAELSEQYRRNPEALSLSGEEREISVLFCDVRDFSSVTQALSTNQLAQWLNMYFDHVSKIVVRHRGSIDKYIGDSVMAVWGAPQHSQTHAFDALHAAMDIENEIEQLNTRYRSAGLPEVAVGIGISTGPAMVGPLGSEHRVDYTVIGDTVNVAQRLEVQTRKYHVPIIVGDKTFEALPDTLFRELDTVTVKGRLQTVTMYQPLCASADASAALLENLAQHDRAMAACVDGRWEDANELFRSLRDTWGPSEMYELYLRGINQAATAGPISRPPTGRTR